MCRLAVLQVLQRLWNVLLKGMCYTPETRLALILFRCLLVELQLLKQAYSAALYSAAVRCTSCEPIVRSTGCAVL
jgi:hypothetical protein